MTTRARLSGSGHPATAPIAGSRRPLRRLYGGIALAMLGASLTFAFDVGTLGTLLDIKTLPSGGAQLVFKSKGAGIAPGPAHTSGDPRCVSASGSGGGGSLRVNGGAANDFEIALPCEGWTARRAPQSSSIEEAADYEYRDRTGATCSKVRLLFNRFVEVKCKGLQVPYGLGATQGNVDVTLRTGTQPERICTRFGPPATKVTLDGSGNRYLARNAPSPRNPDCPSL